MSQGVHLDEAVWVLRLDQICTPIGPFNPLLISLSTVISDDLGVDLVSTLIRHQFLELTVLAICSGGSSLRGTKHEKNVPCPVKCLQLAFHGGK